MCGKEEGRGKRRGEGGCGREYSRNTLGNESVREGGSQDQGFRPKKKQIKA